MVGREGAQSLDGVGWFGWVPLLGAVEAADADGPLLKAFSVFYLEQSTGRGTVTKGPPALSHRRHFGCHIFNLVTISEEDSLNYATQCTPVT